ncbi:MAG: IS200/IS605 family transposase [Candidatus Taylorbacteria bacterium]
MAQSANHSTHDAHYHIVFPVKYRKALLTGDVTLAIPEIAKEISERYDIEFEKIGCDVNHVHLLLSFKPSLSTSEVVGIFKSITAKELFRRFPQLKRDLWKGQFWSDGFYMATVGERGNWNVVKQYIQNQEKTSESVQLKLLN